MNYLASLSLRRTVIALVTLLHISIAHRCSRVLRFFASNSEASVIGDRHGVRRVEITKYASVAR